MEKIPRANSESEERQSFIPDINGTFINVISLDKLDQIKPMYRRNRREHLSIELSKKLSKSNEREENKAVSGRIF